MVSDEVLSQKVASSDVHTDTQTYVKHALQLDTGLGLVSSLRYFATHSTIEDLKKYGTPLEQEILTNGVARLITQPFGKPYGAIPDKGTKRVLERAYEENYL